MFDSEKYDPSCTVNFETIRGDYPDVITFKKTNKKENKQKKPEAP